MRISRPQMFMEFARTCSKRSTCGRLNVGAVVVKGNNVISIGYNGPGPRERHCQGNSCEGFKTGCTRALHAEWNAIERIPNGIEGPFDLYCTHSPCIVCMDHISKSPHIFRTIFETPFRNTSHLDMMSDLYHLTPAGYLTDWRSGNVINDGDYF